jgi:hypothetical protein
MGMSRAQQVLADHPREGFDRETSKAFTLFDTRGGSLLSQAH